MIFWQGQDFSGGGGYFVSGGIAFRRPASRPPLTLFFWFSNSLYYKELEPFKNHKSKRTRKGHPPLRPLFSYRSIEHTINDNISTIPQQTFSLLKLDKKFKKSAVF
jgi:hypothetical protein